MMSALPLTEIVQTCVPLTHLFIWLPHLIKGDGNTFEAYRKIKPSLVCTIVQSGYESYKKLPNSFSLNQLFH